MLWGVCLLPVAGGTRHPASPLALRSCLFRGWWGPPGTSRLTETTNSKASWEKQSSAVKVLAVWGHPEFPVH